MSKRKVQFEEGQLGEDTGDSRSTRFKERHSLDSDEEYVEIEERMNEEDIKGMLGTVGKHLT